MCESDSISGVDVSRLATVASRRKWRPATDLAGAGAVESRLLGKRLAQLLQRLRFGLAGHVKAGEDGERILSALMIERRTIDGTVTWYPPLYTLGHRSTYAVIIFDGLLNFTDITLQVTTTRNTISQKPRNISLQNFPMLFVRFVYVNVYILFCLYIISWNTSRSNIYQCTMQI